MKNKKVILIANDFQIIKQVIIKWQSSREVIGLITEKNMEESQVGLSVYDLSFLDRIDAKDFFYIISDNVNMVYFMKILQAHKLNLIENWVPHWLISGNEINPLKLYELVGKDKARFKKALEDLKKTKKILVLYGNCQTVAISYYLKTVPEISNGYWILSMPWFWIPEEVKKYLVLHELNFFQYIDVFITQNIHLNNRFAEFLATEKVKSKLNKNTKIIYITKIYSSVYYPQYERKTIDKKYINESGLKEFKGFCDINVYNMVRENKSFDEILKTICDENFYSTSFLKNRFEEELKETRKREEICDIKMSDFLQENIGKEILFEANRHPTEFVMIELTRRILDFIGIQTPVKFDGAIHSYGIPGDERTPIYPSVIKQLGLNEEYKNLLYKLPVAGNKVSFKEYMSAYIRRVFFCLENVEGEE